MLVKVIGRATLWVNQSRAKYTLQHFDFPGYDDAAVHLIWFKMHHMADISMKWHLTIITDMYCKSSRAKPVRLHMKLNEAMLISPALRSPAGKESAGICGASSCRCPAPQSWGYPEPRWSWSPIQTLCGWASCAGRHTGKLDRCCFSPGVWMLYWVSHNRRLEALCSGVECTVAHMEKPSCRERTGPVKLRWMDILELLKTDSARTTVLFL